MTVKHMDFNLLLRSIFHLYLFQCSSIVVYSARFVINKVPVICSRIPETTLLSRQLSRAFACENVTL